MNLSQALHVIIRTHLGALRVGKRPSAVELRSAPGLGKSAGVGQACARTAHELNEPFGLITCMATTITSPDVRGFMLPAQGTEGRAMDTIFSTPPWYPTRENTVVYTPDGGVHLKGTWKGPMPRVGIVFLDEFGQGEEDVIKPMAELLLHGEVGNTQLPIGWRVVAASNRMKDRSGVKRPMMFIVNRRMEINVDSDMTTFITYQQGLPKDKRLHHMTLSFAQAHPSVVFTDGVPDGGEQFCTPRSLTLMDADLRSLQSPAEAAADKLPTDSISRECVKGWIGEAACAQFFVHLKYADELPTIDSIMLDPAKAKLPATKDAQMVVGYMLADKIDETNADHVMRYVKRMMMEMQVLTVRAAKAKPEASASLSMSEEFNAWLRAHSDVLLASRA